MGIIDEDRRLDPRIKSFLAMFPDVAQSDVASRAELL